MLEGYRAWVGVLLCVLLTACSGSDEETGSGAGGHGAAGGSGGSGATGTGGTGTGGSGGIPVPPSAACEPEAPPLPAPVTAYYFSQSEGDDGNDGLSEASPKRGVEQIVAMAQDAAPGTHYLLKRGDTWVTTASMLLEDANGTEADPIVVGAYGDGERPTLDGQHTDFIFGVRGGPETGSVHVRIDNIRFITTNSPPNRPSGLYVNESWHPNNPEHITFSNVVVDGLTHGLTLYMRNITVTHSIVSNNFKYPAQGEDGFAQGLYASGENITIRGSLFEANGAMDNWFDHQNYLSGGSGYLVECNTYRNAIDGVKVRRASNTTIQNNVFYDIASAAHAGGDDSGGVQNVIVRNNIAYRVNAFFGVKSESGDGVGTIDGVYVYNNIVYATGIESWLPPGPALITLGDSQTANDIYILHNLLFDAHTRNVFSNNDGANHVIANNIFSRFDDPDIIDVPPAVVQESNLSYTDRATFDSELQLTDADNADFHPTTDATPMYDAAADYTSVASADFEGTTRPQGAMPDIGPFEY